MKLQELINAFNVIKNINVQGEVRFIYKFIKNKKVLEKKVNEEQEILNKIIEPDEKLIEFEKKRLEILNEYGEKDEKGSLKQDVTGNVIVPEEKKEEFNEKLQNLIDEYKEVLDKRQEQMKEYNELLNDEVDMSDIKLYKFKLDELPNNLTVKQIEAMEELGMIKDEGLDE